MSGVSVPSMWSFISKFFCFFFAPPDTSTSSSSNNHTGIHAVPPNRASNFIPLHTIYAYLTGLLLALIEIKYQGSSSDPLKEHPVIMMLFLTTKFVYVSALLTFQFNQINDQPPNLNFFMCHISRTIACELLVLVLVPPIKWFIINVPSLVAVVATFFCYKYLLQLLNSEETQRSEIHSEDRQATEMADVQVEAEMPSSSA